MNLLAASVKNRVTKTAFQKHRDPKGFDDEEGSKPGSLEDILLSYGHCDSKMQGNGHHTLHWKVLPQYPKNPVRMYLLLFKMIQMQVNT